MIKINLLAEGKRPAAVRRATPTGESFLQGENIALLMLIVSFLVPLLVVGALYFKFHRELEAKKAEVAAANEEVLKLQSVLEEVEEFKAKKAELERKIRVINDLRDNQRGPVQVMDAISRALPELLWLDRMNMGPNQITLSGRAFNFNAIANFAENLDHVPEFKEPNLRDSSQQGQVFNFVIAFNYDYTRPKPDTGAGADGDEPTATGPSTAAAGG
jgi:type IV pilus assembly protein PilN